MIYDYCFLVIYPACPGGVTWSDCLPVGIEQVEHERKQGEDPHAGMQLAGFAAQQPDRGIADETGGDTDADVVGEDDQHDGEKSGKQVAVVSEIEVRDRLQHEHADHHQCRTVGLGRNHGEHRGEEQSQNEQQGYHQCGEPCSSSLFDASRRFDVDASRRGAEQRCGDG